MVTVAWTVDYLQLVVERAALAVWVVPVAHFVVLAFLAMVGKAAVVSL